MIILIITTEYRTWVMSATVDVSHLAQVSHDCSPPVVDVVKRCRLQRQLSPDVFTEKYVLNTAHSNRPCKITNNNNTEDTYEEFTWLC